MVAPVQDILQALSDGQGVVPAETLRFLPELLDELGRDGTRFLAERGVDPALLSQRDRPITGYQLIHLLEDAAAVLDCPDIGMRLAARQRHEKMGNLFELVMRNSATVGDALRYCGSHVRLRSGAVSMEMLVDRQSRRAFVRFEFLLPQFFAQGQAVEHMLLRTCNIVSQISDGKVRPAEVHFTHGNIASHAAYRRHFGTHVEFRQPVAGLFFDTADLLTPVAKADPQILQLATFFIENQFPARAVPMAVRVRAAVARNIDGGECTSDHIAALLGLPLRTLQRRLRAEGTSFDAIRDEVRSEIALQCLTRSRVPLSQVAEMLGYAETSAFSRSCHRWFSASPRQLRKRASPEYLAVAG